MAQLIAPPSMVAQLIAPPSMAAQLAARSGERFRRAQQLASSPEIGLMLASMQDRTSFPTSALSLEGADPGRRLTLVALYALAGGRRSRVPRAEVHPGELETLLRYSQRTIQHHLQALQDMGCIKEFDTHKYRRGEDMPRKFEILHGLASSGTQ